MTREELKTQANELQERGKELIAEGNQRYLVFRKKDGDVFFQTTLTIAAAVAAVLLITGFVSIPLLIVAGVIAMVTGLRVEVKQQEAVSPVEA